MLCYLKLHRQAGATFGRKQYFLRMISYKFEQKLRLIISIFYSKAKVGQQLQQLVPTVRRTKIMERFFEGS